MGFTQRPFVEGVRVGLRAISWKQDDGAVTFDRS